MSENQISELCEKIYRKHRKAIDLLFEHRPDLYSQTNAKVKELVSYVSPDFQLELDHCTKSYVRFCSLPWDEMPMQTSGDGSWTKSKRVILGEVEVMSSGVCLKLVLGPGDSKFRESVFKLAKANPEFKGCSKSLYEKWTQIYKVVLIKKKEMDEYSWDSIEPLLQQEWERIMYHGEFEKILSILRDLQPDSKGLESKAEEEVE